MAHEALWEKIELGVMVQGNDVGERGHVREDEKELQLSVQFSLFLLAVKIPDSKC